MTPSARRLLAVAAAAVLVAGAAYLATSVLYAAASGGTIAALGATLAYFGLTALVAAVLLGVLLAVGRMRRRWLIVVLALVAAVVAVVVGVALTLMIEGNAFGGALAAYAVESILQYGLLFELLVALLVLPIARPVLARLDGAPRGRRRALVRAPAPREGVDGEALVREWRAVVAALEGAGWAVQQVEADPELPDALFVEDAAVVIGDTAVLCHPGEERRRAELPAVRDALRAAGLEVRAIEWPGTLDGGDVVRAGGTVHVLRSPQTNAEGIRQLRAIGAGLGVRVVAVAKRAQLDAAAGLPEAADPRVLALDAETVLVPASARTVAKRLADLGLRTVTVDIPVIEAAGGSVRRLVLPLQDETSRP